MNSQAKVATLMYHEVTDNPSSSGFQSGGSLDYKLSVSEFSRHLDTIAGNALVPKLVHQVDFSLNERHLLITFDDGGASAMYSADCLEERGWKGHFFVTTNRIGCRGWLSSADIRELHSRGHVVGSHSHTHPDPLFLITKQELLNEYEHSINLLKDILGAPVVSASFSGGDIGRHSLSDFAALELPYCFTSEITYRPVLLEKTIFLGRVCPKRHTSIKLVDKVVNFASLSQQQTVRLCKQVVKKILYRRKKVIQ